MDTSERKYVSYESALRADEIGPHRYIPMYVPRDATDIRIISNVESNEGWLSFRAANDSIALMLTSCSRIPWKDVRLPRYAPDGWPRALEPRDRKPPSDYDYYRCHSHGVTAIQPGSGEVFDWRFSS
jgi:hypothetical protein